MDIIITSCVSVLICCLQPVVNNSSLGRTVIRNLILPSEPEHDVEYWVVKDKFTRSKIKYFYTLEQANDYSRSLFVSHVIFDRHQNIVRVGGIGFGKNICKHSGKEWLESYYNQQRSRVSFVSVYRNLFITKRLFRNIPRAHQRTQLKIISKFEKTLGQTEIWYKLGYYKKASKNIDQLNLWLGLCIYMIRGRMYNNLEILSYWILR